MLNRLFLLIAICCAFASTVQPQKACAQVYGGGSPTEYSFIICMSDTNIIYQSAFYPYAFLSSNPSIQSLLSAYTVYSVEKAYPSSRFRSIRSFYRIKANSLGLLDALLGYPLWFPAGFEEMIPVPAYEPTEFFNGSGCDTFLRYINANGAWDYTQGDPNVVIGISDTYFDLTNPDLIGRIATIRDNTPSPSTTTEELPHGTETSGFAVGNMNNGGLVGVGGFCKLDISSHSNDDVMLALSAGKDTIPPRKIINGSWVQPDYECDTNFNSMSYALSFGGQIYDEIYENGTTSVFAAGNSGKSTPLCGMYTAGDSSYIFEEADVRAYMFPASYDHVLSISGVGFNPNHYISSFLGETGAWNWSDIHSLNALDSSHTWHHNNRVDLLAPAAFMPALTYIPDSPNVHTTPLVAGTSYSAPMVAGTVGLMQSVANNQCLSPYQVEYILKTTARNVDTVPQNVPYAGMLGAGVLNAGAAVAAAEFTPLNNPCNDPTTQTLHIKSIEINTICAPGYSSNGVKPKLSAILENGTPPYTYKWEPIYGANSGTLDTYDIAEPTILSATWAWDGQVQKLRAAFWVSVTDASPVPKVASRSAIIYLDTSGYELAMRDGPMDFFREPYSAGNEDPRERIWWSGSDIWNRRTNDGGLDHQNPEYYTTDSNYLYTRIRNVGCAPSPDTAKLRLYWTLQSTGEDWDYDWKQANYPNDTTLPAGREITNIPMHIPALQPGEDTILVHAWRTQNPTDYDPNVSELNACILARIEERSTYPYGMSHPEDTGDPVSNNVKYNNNICTRNLSFVNLAPGNVVPENLVIIGNPFGNSTVYTLQLANDKSIRRHMSGDFSAIGFIRIKLGQPLYDRWMLTGGHGNYSATDDKNYTVDYDGSGILNLEGIELEAHEHIPITLQFIQRDHAVTTGIDYTFHLQQVMRDIDPEMPDLDPLIGGVDFVVHTEKPEETISKKSNVTGILQQNGCKVYPNPTTSKIYIENKTGIKAVTLCDIAGRALYANITGANEVSLQGIKAGIYILSVTDAINHTERFKIIKQ